VCPGQWWTPVLPTSAGRWCPWQPSGHYHSPVWHWYSPRCNLGILSSSAVSITKFVPRWQATNLTIRLKNKLTKLTEGADPLHKVQFLIFCNPLDSLVARFMNSNPKAFLSNTSKVLSILRRSCRPVPRFFIHLLLHSFCLRPWNIMPLLHSGLFHRLFPNIYPFRVFCTILSWLYLLRSCPLSCATFVWWVISLWATYNSSRYLQFPWIRLFLKTFPLPYATAAWRDTSYKQHPTSSRIHNLLG
jgi:hypothetical protein